MHDNYNSTHTSVKFYNARVGAFHTPKQLSSIIRAELNKAYGDRIKFSVRKTNNKPPVKIYVEIQKVPFGIWCPEYVKIVREEGWASPKLDGRHKYTPEASDIMKEVTRIVRSFNHGVIGINGQQDPHNNWYYSFNIDFHETEPYIF